MLQVLYNNVTVVDMQTAYMYLHIFSVKQSAASRPTGA